MSEHAPFQAYPGTVEVAANQPAPISVMTAVTRMKGVDYPGQRFEIDKESSPITAGDLRTLVNLPYEVGLHEDDGVTVLNRGDETDVNLGDASRDTRWMLHTHPFGSENTTLSPFDVLATWRYDHEQTTHLLATEDGVLVYRAPQHEPGQPDQPIRDILRTFALWGSDRGVGNVFRGQGTMTMEDCTSEIRKFIADTGMFVDKAAWDDQAGLDRALAIINDKPLSTTTPEAH